MNIVKNHEALLLCKTPRQLSPDPMEHRLAGKT